ncbi:MAG: hypothetical protein QOF37_321, partial [Thermoleophilaceae bacterium]|nr:hypothetical protein [Thermoleophilaceae bacterium]
MARKWWTLTAVCVATFMLILDVTVVNVALPSIRKDLGASFTDLQWVVDAYALTLAAFVLTSGSLADLLGRRRVFIVGLAVFTAASAMCALSVSPVMLNLSRAVQGVGGAVMFAVSLALLGQEFRGRERATATAIYGASIGVAVAAGPLVGGALTDGIGWSTRRSVARNAANRTADAISDPTTFVLPQPSGFPRIKAYTRRALARLNVTSPIQSMPRACGSRDSATRVAVTKIAPTPIG